MLAIVGVVTPVVVRARKNVDTEVGSARNQAAHASDSPDATENVVTFLASEVSTIDNALAHIKSIVNERRRVVDIVTLLDIRNNELRKSRSRRAIGHEALLEKASQQKVASLTIGLGVARTLDVHVTVELEEIHFAVAIEHEREIDRDIVHSNGIAFFFEIGSTLYLVDIHF